jgi:hypothetical protein
MYRKRSFPYRSLVGNPNATFPVGATYEQSDLTIFSQIRRFLIRVNSTDFFVC